MNRDAYVLSIQNRPYFCLMLNNILLSTAYLVYKYRRIHGVEFRRKPFNKHLTRTPSTLDSQILGE